MTRSRVNTALAWLLLAPLAACGGSNTDVLSAGSRPGGGTGGGAPAPTPPPPSGAAYVPYASIATQTKFGAPVSDSIEYDTGSPGAPRYRSGEGDITYDPASNRYFFSYYGNSGQQLTPGDDAAGNSFTVNDLATSGSPLVWSRLLTWTTRDAEEGETAIARSLVGVSTRFDDAPTGTATYNQIGLQGNARKTGVLYSLGNSTFNLTADFAALTVGGTLKLVGTPDAGGADIALGDYVMVAGTVRSSQLFGSSNGLTFLGDWVRVGLSKDVGDASGKFYGPQAAEYGMSFDIEDDGLNASGISVGRKQ